MNNEIADRLAIKLFVGILFTSEIRMHINENIVWKERTLKGNQQAADLQEVHYHGKDYLGFYAAHETLSLNQMRDVETEIQKRISNYCPLLQKENPQIFIFPQLFIA
jgi:hypothetical protein